MKKWIMALIAIFMLSAGAASAEQGFDTASPAAILVDAESGMVLFEKDADSRRFPASLTKIMTAILALEQGNVNDIITAGRHAVTSIGPGSSHMGLYVGERLSLTDLLHGLLVYSGNDAANVIAEHIAGDTAAFLEMMNAKAAELGMANTHYMNTHGLHDEQHYTTPRDMTILCRYAMKNESFREIVAKPTYIIAPNDKYKETRNLHTTNHLLLKNNKYYYEPAIGIKTGYTSQAGNCLASAAKRGNFEEIAVIMGAQNVSSESMIFTDSKNLLKYGFDSFKRETIAKPGTLLAETPIRFGKGMSTLMLATDQYVNILVPASATSDSVLREAHIYPDITAPVQKDDVLGYMTFNVGGVEMARVDLLADKACEFNVPAYILSGFISIITWPFFYVPAILLALMIALLRQRKKKADRGKRPRYTGMYR